MNEEKSPQPLINRYNSYLKEKFQGRVQKVSLDVGFTCPNRDGTKGKGGCTYCNNSSFSPAVQRSHLDLKEQIDTGIAALSKRYKNVVGHLAYFQAYSNTYGDLKELKKVYQTAIEHPNIVGLCIGTRPDCVDKEKLDYFAKINETFPIFLEFGIESIFDETLKRINRGHSFECSQWAIKETAKRSLSVAGHLILGFPWESTVEWPKIAQQISTLPLDSLKLHQLHVVKNTVMGREYSKSPFKLPSSEEYIDGLALFLAHLKRDIAIQRIFAQAPKDMLLSPRWEESTQELENHLIEVMKKRALYHGKFHK